MNREISSFKPGEIINLESLPSNQFENKKKLPKPETYWPQLRIKLSQMSERLNAQYGDNFNAAGRIKMVGAEADLDRGVVALAKQGWAKPGELSQAGQENREKNPSNITEVALTLLFERFFQEEFLIIRSSEYDDYENGTDQLLIDKKTGAVICGLDDVIGHIGDDGGEKKSEKIKRKMDKGGAVIRYAAAVSPEGELIRKELHNVPLFYFSLSKTELNSIAVFLTSRDSEQGLEAKKVVVKLLDSLGEQADGFLERPGLGGYLKYNLKAVKTSLDKMQSILG